MDGECLCAHLPRAPDAGISARRSPRAPAPSHRRPCALHPCRGCLRLPETFGPKSAIDFGGVSLITGGAFGLVWGLVRGNGVGWTSGEIILALGLSALLIIAFVAWELRRAQPMIPMRLFALRAFT